MDVTNKFHWARCHHLFYFYIVYCLEVEVGISGVHCFFLGLSLGEEVLIGAWDWMEVLSFLFHFGYHGLLAVGISSFVCCVGEVMRRLQCITLGSSLDLWLLALCCP
ncbi:hypothetical protein K440DRAFT_11905 [Wilcoxina mikolae CBS 423.85]|nr:hypothetical protein K440DRAFT_11905 [Wilcoxina mikolae CBS 423.85]